MSAASSGDRCDAGDRYRALVRRGRLLVQPSVATAFEALVAEASGIRAVSIGGYAVGARTGLTEPLLSLDDMRGVTERVSAVTRLPILVDAGAGWGEPIHVSHAVASLGRSGAAAVHIEDQVFPKRAHYHRGVEHTVSRSEFIDRITAAREAGMASGIVVVARTDAIRTESYAEAIARLELAFDAGAELGMLFPTDRAQTIAAPADMPGANLIYVNSTGNRQGRGVFSNRQLEDWGWSVVYDSSSTSICLYDALTELFTGLMQDGINPLDVEATRVLRHDIESLIGLDRLYAVESRTVETGRVTSE